MEQEKSKCRHCYNCGFYSPYYLKGNIKFNKADEGHCRANRARVNRHDTCDRWQNASYRIKHFYKPSTERALLEILSQLSEIRQIIEEAQKGE